MMKLRETEEQMRLGYFAKHAALTLRLQMGDDINFMMTIEPLGQDAERLKTVKVLCDKKVHKGSI